MSTSSALSAWWETNCWMPLLSTRMPNMANPPAQPAPAGYMDRFTARPGTIDLAATRRASLEDAPRFAVRLSRTSLLPRAGWRSAEPSAMTARPSAAKSARSSARIAVRSATAGGIARSSSKALSQPKLPRRPARRHLRLPAARPGKRLTAPAVTGGARAPAREARLGPLTGAPSPA